MFSFLSKKQTKPAAETVPAPPSLDQLHEKDLAVIFKHSQTCPVSWAAEKQVKRFLANHPGAPVYTVLVQRDRELSLRIAERTGIRHESPQIIVLRRGEVVASTSHEGVTVDFLAGAVAAEPAPTPSA